MADPGFPVGRGINLIGGIDSRGGYVSKILYVETKESVPLGIRQCTSCLKSQKTVVVSCAVWNGIYLQIGIYSKKVSYL